MGNLAQTHPQPPRLVLHIAHSVGSQMQPLCSTKNREPGLDADHGDTPGEFPGELGTVIGRYCRAVCTRKELGIWFREDAWPGSSLCHFEVGTIYNYGRILRYQLGRFEISI